MCPPHGLTAQLVPTAQFAIVEQPPSCAEDLCPLLVTITLQAQHTSLGPLQSPNSKRGSQTRLGCFPELLYMLNSS